MISPNAKRQLTDWFNQWGRPLRRFLVGKAGVPAADVEDVAQEVFLRLIRYEKAELEDHPQAYLYKVASNVAIEWSLRAHNRLPHDQKWLDELIDREQPDIGFEHAASEAEIEAETTTDVSEAIFGNITANLTTRLKASVGVRVEHSVVEHQNLFLAGGFAGALAQQLNFPDQPANPVMPRASLTYDYTDSNMVYASVAKGFRPGGSQETTVSDFCQKSLQSLGLTSVPATFTSDSLWSYEVGAKGIAFDRRFSYDASVYYIRWSDIQTPVPLPSCGITFTTNFGRAISQGFDLQLTALLVDGLKVSALLGYTHVYYPDTEYGGAPSPGAPRAILADAGQPVGETLGVAGTGNLSSPPWTAAANANYSYDIGRILAAGTGYLRVDYRWIGKQPCACDFPNVTGYDPTVESFPNESYSLVNLRLGVSDGGLDVSAYVNNAANADPRLSYTHYGTLSPFIFEEAQRPRTFGITAWYRFR